MTIRPAAAMAALALLAGCSDMAVSVVCPAEPPPAVAIAVTHPVTGIPLTSDASGWFAVGARQDSLRFHPGGGVLVAEGGPGSYRVEVTVPGHESWRHDALHVAEDACGVRTVYVVASPRPAE